MSLVARRRLAAALLAAFAAWPLVHYELVRRYDLDIWKFAGWAMYIQPLFVPEVDVFELRDGERVELPLLDPPYDEARAVRDGLREQALYWGTLVDLRPLERATRAASRSTEPIEIVVTRYFVDPVSDRTTGTRRSYLYPADGGPPTVW